ncbi:MAG: M48 family metalloprotease [Rudaea sp.]|uniref:M48 family metalloprotease n=1 Tax=Rudaea sp. TaxID=2136325 RepID=UPI0039E6DAD1
MFAKHSALAVFVAAIAVLTSHGYAADTRLPNLGSSAGNVASPEEQRQYGFYVLHELRNQNAVLDDPLLADYLNTLGYKLVSYSPQPEQSFTFFIMRENEINAFALPGGFVAVNSTLFTTTDTESELAAVLAHEISHVTQNHLIRAVEAEQKMTPLMLVGMLVAMAAASKASPYSTSNSDIGAIATMQGLAAQMQINFTRADEAEADRVGIATLAKAGFDPDAMAGFFERMQRALRPGFDENDVPALLMDHPVTTTRISEAKARAEQIKKEYRPTVTVGDVEAAPKELAGVANVGPATGGAATAETKAAGAADGTARAATIATGSLLASIGPTARPNIGALHATQPTAEQRASAQAYYELMRERVRVLASPRVNETIAYYADNLRDHKEFDTPANHYGYALALIQSGKAKQAIAPLQKLAAADPENLVFQIALGSAELQSGARDAALQRYAHMEKSFPNNRALALAHADALLQYGDKAAGKQAQELLRPQLAKDDEDPALQTTFARACELAGDPVRAGEAHATAAYLNGRAEDALNQLKDIAKRSDLDYYQRTRVEALIAAMTPLVLDYRRHKIRPEDQGKLAATANCLKPKSGLSFSVHNDATLAQDDSFARIGDSANGYGATSPFADSRFGRLDETTRSADSKTDCGAASFNRNN